MEVAGDGRRRRRRGRRGWRWATGARDHVRRRVRLAGRCCRRPAPCRSRPGCRPGRRRRSCRATPRCSSPSPAGRRWRAGEWVAVLGAGGGIGLATVDVAKALGARVVAVRVDAGRSSRRPRRPGPTRPSPTTTTDVDLKAAIREATGGGADVRRRPGRRAEGRAGAAGAAVDGPLHRHRLRRRRRSRRCRLNQVLLNNRTVVGVDWGAWTFRDPAGNAALLGRARSTMVGRRAAAPGRAGGLPARRGRPGPRRPPGTAGRRQGSSWCRERLVLRRTAMTEWSRAGVAHEVVGDRAEEGPLEAAAAVRPGDHDRGREFGGRAGTAPTPASPSTTIVSALAMPSAVEPICSRASAIDGLPLGLALAVVLLRRRWSRRRSRRRR